MNITVYCGVALGNDPAFEESARQLGAWIGKAGHTLVYGGGGIGMMGALSNAVLEAGGKVRGVIPQFLVDREQVNERLDDLVVVDTMAQRKTIMMDEADAFVMLPGGIGTFEEITEVLSCAKLGFLDAPVCIVNVKGCYDHFVASLAALVDKAFLGENDCPFTVVESASEVAELLSPGGQV